MRVISFRILMINTVEVSVYSSKRYSK